ncbi:MAG: DUF4199 domain-containing protein [Bacteroidetes bacterium]|nr:DUF4199 domain-containing protein [Bacteroidota bacterium]
MSDSLNQKIKKRSIVSGLVLGVILLVFGVISYYLITSQNAGAGTIILAPYLFKGFLPIILVLFLCFNLRKKIGGYWTFREAVSGIFIMFVISYSIQVLGYDVLFARVIEPDMLSKTQVATLRATTELGEKTKASQAAIDQRKADIQKQFDLQKNISFFGILQNYVFYLIFLFVFALIFAALFRRNPPEYMPPVNPDE